MTRRGRQLNAFTLVEVLISLAVLALGLVGIMAMIGSATSLHKRAVDQTVAAMVAEKVFEEKQAQAMAGATPEEMSTKSGSEYAFARSTMYPSHEYKAICTAINYYELKLIVEVRVHPQSARQGTATPQMKEGGNLRFETILLRAGVEP